MRIVPAPPPVVQRAGSLLAAAHTPSEALDRAEAAGYHGQACTGWGVFDPCGSQVLDHGADVTGDEVAAVPFAVIADDVCTAFGATLEVHRARARARLDAVESAAIAHELWTGELAAAAAGGDAGSPWAANPRLAAGADVTDVTPGAGALSPKAGLALLEQKLGDMLAGAAGAIHGTRQAVTVLPDLRAEGDLLLTRFATRVIGDAGYPGTGPDGAAPAAGEAWLYATARPTVRRSDVSITPGSLAEALDRAVNTVRFTAERLAQTTFPCGVLAVRITLT